VSIGGAEVSPAYYDWLIDAERVVFKQAPNQDDVALPHVAAPAEGRLEVQIESEQMPADFVVVLFDDIGPDGVPVSSEGRQVDCLAKDEPCQLTHTHGLVHATIDVDQSTQIAVVQLLYSAKSAKTGQVEHMNGSWGVRLDSSR
jgi:hypothetical protein